MTFSDEIEMTVFATICLLFLTNGTNFTRVTAVNQSTKQLLKNTIILTISQKEIQRSKGNILFRMNLLF